MIRHDDVGVARDRKALAADVFLRQRVNLTQEDLGIHDAAIADDRGHVVVHDTRRNEVQRQMVLGRDDRVAGVVAALEAHHVIIVAGEKVGNLTLAFIAPLRTDKNSCGHGCSFRIKAGHMRTSADIQTKRL